MKRASLVLGAALGFAVIFYASLFAFAEIGTEVVVLRTFDAEGAAHETRIMVIDLADSAWVRGRAYRGWFRRIEANADAELYRGGTWSPIRAAVSRDPSDAAAFEQEMVERYGITYRCFDLIARMSSNEIPVRLDPRIPRPPSA